MWSLLILDLVWALFVRISASSLAVRGGDACDLVVPAARLRRARGCDAGDLRIWRIPGHGNRSQSRLTNRMRLWLCSLARGPLGKHLAAERVLVRGTMAAVEGFEVEVEVDDG